MKYFVQGLFRGGGGLKGLFTVAASLVIKGSLKIFSGKMKNKKNQGYCFYVIII